MANPCHVRSISLPSRSHPTTLKIQEVLNKLKTLEASSTSTLGAICNGLSRLLLDICGTVRDVVSKFEENVRDLRSALRRKKRDLCRESSISNYIYSKKKMNKDAKKLLAAMKKMDTTAGASPLLDQDQQLSTVIRVLTEGIVSCEEKHDNVKELENMDFALRAVSSERADLETMQIAHKGLEALEFSIEGLDNGLECMFRHLIKTRASLLNIISH
ncbi:hypothetical protein VitviT2T_005766 [Vitis vinifera]|uniref:Uncharacterized protein n=1 Tax=Vitis vinifera TaxID=29760 RepID=A0ABY9BTT4_VITVI|nr:hypothetical protein VitviT2T_005766 [Vitis vinifera]